MSYISYESTNTHRTSTEIAIHYHVRRALLGDAERQREPHREIIYACLEGPLYGALHEIQEWGKKWAPMVAPGFDPGKGPEIALNLNVTTKGNLEVTWTPIMTQEQYDAAPNDFRRWIEQLGFQPIAQRRDTQLYFIREFDMLQQHLKGDYVTDAILELSRISAVALAVMIAELPSKLEHLVQAHWQHVMEFNFAEDDHRSTPICSSIAIWDAWYHSKAQSEDRLKRALKAIGTDEKRLTKEWGTVAITNPRVRTDGGRSKVVAEVLGVSADQVQTARQAIESVKKWQEDKPRLWWNRRDPYPSWWGGRN